MIQRVELYNRQKCCGDRTKDVSVRVADELPASGSEIFDGGSLLGSFPGPGTNGQKITISG